MDRDGIITLLGYLGGNSRVQVGRDWVRAPCPMAPWTHDSGSDTHPSFAVRIAPGRRSMFNCFSCRAGDLFELVAYLRSVGAHTRGYDIRRAIKLVHAEADSPLSLAIKDYGQAAHEADDQTAWPEWWLESFRPAARVQRAMRYLAGRGMTKAQVGRLNVRWDSSREAVCFPVRNWGKALVGMRGRRIDPASDEPPYHMYDYRGHKSSLVWYGEEWASPDCTVLMVESVFDAVSCLRESANVIAPMTVGMSARKVARVDGVFPFVVTLFDRGKGGDKAREIISGKLTTPHLHLQPPRGRKDPGEMTQAEVRKLLRNHIKRL